MLKQRLESIVSDVRVCIDENASNESEFLFGSDDRELDNIIKSKVEDAIRYALRNANLSFLEPTITNPQLTIDRDSVRFATCELSDDFLRFVSVKSEGWAHHVSEPILSTDRAYATLKNPITTGYLDNPKAAIMLNGEKMSLELYGMPQKKEDGQTVDVTLSYIRDVKRIEEKVEEKQVIYYNIPDKVYRGVIYYTAGATLQAFKDAHGDVLISQATQMIQ
jgi:hypothetical protein